MTLNIAQSIGLHVSKYSLTFSGVDGQPEASQTMMIDAKNTYSSYARVAQIVFSSVTTAQGSPWDGHTPASMPVRFVRNYSYSSKINKVQIANNQNKHGDRQNNNKKFSYRRDSARYGCESPQPKSIV